MNDYSAASSAALGAFFFIIVLISLGLGILAVIGMWKTFEKAGQPGWAAIVPIYNMYIITKIIGKPWYWLLLMIIPYVGIIWFVWSMNLLSKSFGKTEGFTVGLVFLSFIFFLILGFSKDIQYIGPSGVPVQSTNDTINSIGAI